MSGEIKTPFAKTLLTSIFVDTTFLVCYNVWTGSEEMDDPHHTSIDFERDIASQFRDRSLIETAMRRSAYAKEHRCKSNQRLEFLGDSVLDCVVSEWLCELMPDSNEGVLTERRAATVCKHTLSKVGRRIGLYEHIRFGSNEDSKEDTISDSVFEDAFEAVIGAVFTDRGYEAARDFIKMVLEYDIVEIIVEEKTTYKHAINQLQELAQAQGSTLRYDVKEIELTNFVAHIILDGRNVTHGYGNSEKSARTQSSKNALRIWDQLGWKQVGPPHVGCTSQKSIRCGSRRLRRGI